MTVDGILALFVPCSLPYEDTALLKSVWLCGHRAYVYLLVMEVQSGKTWAFKWQEVA